MDGSYQYGNWVLIGLGIYMVLMLFIGWYASKKITTTTDYVVAGRRLGIFFCTGTLFATWFGSGTCMGGAGNAYIFGNQGVIFDPWGAAVCLLLTGFFFARLEGPGKVWLQSLPFSRLAGRIWQAAPQTGGTTKGEGSILGKMGGIGGIFDGD